LAPALLVYLSDADLAFVDRKVATLIQNAQRRGQASRYGQDGDTPGSYWFSAQARKNNLVGFRAECAVAKCLAIPWSPSDAGATPIDVGPYQVRATDAPDGHLILHPSDPDVVTILVVAVTVAKYRLVGWIDAQDGKNGRYWKDLARNGRPAFFVPQSDLHPFPLPTF